MNDKKDESEVIPYTLRSIYLKKSSLVMADDFDPTIPGQALSAQAKSTGGHIYCKERKLETEGGEIQIERYCQFTINFGFRYVRPTGSTEKDHTDQDTEALFVAEITAEFVADYLIGMITFPSTEQLDTWAKSNVLLHTWPFWREFCQTSLARMNLPVITVPILQIKQPWRKEVAEKTE